MHGYQIMQKLEARSGGAWRPAPAPSTRRSSCSRTRAWSRARSPRAGALLADRGRQAESRSSGAIRDSPSGRGRRDRPALRLRQAAMSLAGAVKQVAMTARPTAQKRLEILRDARKKVHARLADAEYSPGGRRSPREAPPEPPGPGSQVRAALSVISARRRLVSRGSLWFVCEGEACGPAAVRGGARTSDLRVMIDAGRAGGARRPGLRRPVPPAAGR